MKLEMSALGQKQTFAVQKRMSALPPKADIRVLWTKGGHRLGLWVRQLIASQELIYREPFTAHVYQIQSPLGPRVHWPQSTPRLHSLPPPI